jgi:hypothetical protein
VKAAHAIVAEVDARHLSVVLQLLLNFFDEKLLIPDRHPMTNLPGLALTAALKLHQIVSAFCNRCGTDYLAAGLVRLVTVGANPEPTVALVQTGAASIYGFAIKGFFNETPIAYELCWQLLMLSRVGCRQQQHEC